MRPVVIFTHIPKVAGTSLVRKLVLPNYPRDLIKSYKGELDLLRSRGRYQVLVGHSVYGIQHLVTGPVKMFTMLRDPIERAISHYYERRFNVAIDPDSEAIVTLGSKEGLANLASAVTSPGDVILVPNPSYPIHPYGFTKASIENFLENLSLSKNKIWSICSLRYFNPTGAHPSGLIGEDPKNDFNNIFPLINKVGIQEDAYLNIYGNDWPTRDGTCIRDYIHVMDLSDAHIIALEHLFRDHTKEFLTLNIGTGQGVSLLELVRCFQNVNNIKIPYVFSKRRDGDIASLVANNSKAERIIGWTPSRTLEDMCVDAWNWKCLNH